MTKAYLLYALLILHIQHMCIAFGSVLDYFTKTQNGEFDFTSFFLNLAVGFVCWGVIVYFDKDYFTRLFTPREK